MSKNAPWPAERVEQLLTLWATPLTRVQIADRLGVGEHAVEQKVTRLRRAGVAVPHRRSGPAPARMCPCGTPIAPSTARSAKVCGSCQRAALRKPAPADLKQVAEGQGVLFVASHYGVTRAVARRWMNEGGIERKSTGFQRRPGPTIRETLAARAAINRKAHQPAPQYRHIGHAGSAAEFLQRLGPVFRCTERGAADPQGTHWRRGSAILTDAEIIERAEAKGWKADAWSTLPATEAARHPA